MGDPVLIELDEGEWNEAATSIQEGVFRKPSWANAGAFKFYWTSRPSSGGSLPAPDDSDETDGGLSIPLFEDSRTEWISFSENTDVFVYIKNADDDETDSTKIRGDFV